MAKTNRQLGIDFLRMLCMYMIVVHHIMAHGAIVLVAAPGTGQYAVVWTAEILTYCAVDTFALISGYVGVNAGFKWSRLLALWLQVVFYSVLFAALGAYFVPDLNTLTIIKIAVKALLPITTETYWYITAYAGMFVFIPILNLALEKLERKRLETILAAVLIFFCALPRFTTVMFKFDEPYTLYQGYSMAWLSILYLMGGYIQKYNIAKHITKRRAIALFAASTAFTWASKLAMEYAATVVLGSFGRGELFISYLSPTIVLNAVALLCFFANTEFRSKTVRKLVSALSPAALGTYLIHDSQFVRERFIQGSTMAFASFAPARLAACLLLYALLIYCVCTLIELARLRLFGALKVKQRCRRLDDFLEGESK